MYAQKISIYLESRTRDARKRCIIVVTRIQYLFSSIFKPKHKQKNKNLFGTLEYIEYVPVHIDNT